MKASFNTKKEYYTQIESLNEIADQFFRAGDKQEMNETTQLMIELKKEYEISFNEVYPYDNSYYGGSRKYR